MITTSISFEFLKRLHSIPSWTEIGYAFERQLISPNVVIDYAMDKVASADQPDDDELAIASSSVNNSIVALVQKLAMAKGVSENDELNLRWANITLAWAYERREQVNDLLDVAESIYTDFDYPEELSAFVRYMPSDAPDLGSVEANENRMIASIGKYVEQFVTLTTPP